MTAPNAYGETWYAAGMADTPARGPLSLELDVDLCVIGGGLAGLTVALEVARRGWSVAVLEARRIAWNASGRGAGFVLPGYSADVQSIIDKVGLDHARKLWRASEQGVEYVRRAARDMPGAELDENGWLHATQTDDGQKLADHADFLRREFGAAAQFWTAEQVRTQLRSMRYFGGLHLPGAFSINPLKYALGLAAAAEAAGARIFEETPALEIDPAGVRKRITTPSARLRAGHVVLAGNVYIDTLMPALGATLMPIWSHTVVTEPLGERLRDAVRFGGMVTDNESGDSDYRIVGGDRLLWSDRWTVGQREPRNVSRPLLADIRRIYPQIGKVQAEYAWSGAIGTPVHRMPQIGELSQGVWLLGGFGGHGINTTAIGGEFVARAIVDGGQAWRLFEPFDLVWAGGRAGRAAVKGFYWYNRARERTQAWLASRRSPGELPPVDDAPPVAESQAEPEETAAKPKRRRREAKPDGAAP